MHRPDIELQDGQNAAMGNGANCKLGLAEKTHPDHGNFSGALPLSVKCSFYINNMFCYYLMLIFSFPGNIRCKPDISRKIRAWV